jgi:predicted  nucleic acid-binding Zn-ribbon protein
VEEDLLSLFERLFASKGDAAVVALEHEVCTGCHMKVTTQTAHRVKNGKEIVSCEQCAGFSTRLGNVLLVSRDR